MDKTNKGAGEAREPHATYTARGNVIRRPPAKDILDRLRRFREQYALKVPDGKTVVDLVREERER